MHYNGASSYLLINDTDIQKFKAKLSEVNAIPLCLGDISKDFLVDNMKKTRLNAYDMFMILVLIMMLLLLMIH